MFHRKVILVPVGMLQRAVSDFTMSQRPFTSFPADKLEHIMRYYHAMPHGFYYAGLVHEGGEEFIKFQSGAGDMAWDNDKHMIEFRQKHIGSGVKLLTSGG